MQPSVGRIVHYVSRGSADGRFPSVCRAAIITEVVDIGGPYENAEDLPREPVALAVLNPTGVFFDDTVEHDEDSAGGTWHWPERVE